MITPRKLRSYAIAGVACSTVVACSDLFAVSTTSPLPSELPVGSWARLGKINDGYYMDGGMTLKPDGWYFHSFCVEGVLPQHIPLDTNGHFDVQGTYDIQSKYKAGGELGLMGHHPARYVGSTDGKVLQMTVTLLDLKRDLGPINLVFGKEFTYFGCD